MTSTQMVNAKIANENKENHKIHSLLLDIYFSEVNIPEKVTKSIEAMQNSNESKRALLKQQVIGYLIACKDFETIDSMLCNMIIDRLHDIK